MAIAPTTSADGVRTMDEAFARMLDADTHVNNIPDALRRNNPMGPGPSLGNLRDFESSSACAMCAC